MTREQKSHRVTGALFIAFGCVFAAGAWPPLYPLVSLYVDLAHWPFNRAPEVADPTIRLLLAVTGGVTAGLGATIWTASGQLMTDHPQAARHVIRNTALVWFVVDSAFSLVAGAPMNAALNLVFLAAVLWPMREPLAATKPA